MSLPSTLLNYARQLRKDQTDAEKRLWHFLRGRRFCGLKFRRQCPFEGYILDFYCHDASLAIELDGGGHTSDEQRMYDHERTKILNCAGIRVIRFWNNEVLNSMEDVLNKLYSYIPADTPLSTKGSPSSGLRPPSPPGRRDKVTNYPMGIERELP
ncbi:endonuclease domain-containing protein [Trichlorobacter lovleyi]|uniref:endonuclease domain-containing protein n=1 Tax=Trichlorobacter lovleyi TaxID=313985 RepID=UPI00223FBBF1|nr:endonuclease domain-containing protein [Trichlorobacter lovleyi]QOX78526.1 endonuclease domain-containing protein [Trichlorobacter lovleyi]